MFRGKNIFSELQQNYEINRKLMQRSRKLNRNLKEIITLLKNYLSENLSKLVNHQNRKDNRLTYKIDVTEPNVDIFNKCLLSYLCLIVFNIISIDILK